MANELITIFFIVTIAIVIISVLYLYHPQDNTNNSPPNPIATTPEQQITTMTPISGWGPQTPVNGLQGVCLVYTFGSTITNRDILYGNPTVDFNTLIFNSSGIPSGSTPLNPITASKGTNPCVYPDQLSAKLVQHTCESQASQGYRCVERNGSIASVGQKEEYFVPCPLPQCTNTLSFVSVGFNVEPNTPIPCIAEDRTGIPDVEVLPCQYNPRFLFDITRADDGTLTPNPLGVIAKIQNRESGKCLNVAGLSANSRVIMTDCTLNGGFNWHIIPPTEFTVDGKTVTTVQQVCYGTGRYPTKEELFPGNGVNCMALEFNRVIIQRYGVPGLTLDQTQFLDYSLYNILANTSVPSYPLLLNFPGSL